MTGDPDPTTLPKLLHLAVAVHDLDRSLAFYRIVTGQRSFASGRADSVPLGASFGWDRAVLRWARVRVRNAQLHLLEFEYPTPWSGRIDPNDNGAMHLCLEVDDLTGLLERLIAAGHVPEGRPQPDVRDEADPSRSVLLCGPDGENVELLEHVNPLALDGA